jgi:hypothetical protein
MPSKVALIIEAMVLPTKFVTNGRAGGLVGRNE